MSDLFNSVAFNSDKKKNSRVEHPSRESIIPNSFSITNKNIHNPIIPEEYDTLISNKAAPVHTDLIVQEQLDGNADSPLIDQEFNCVSDKESFNLNYIVEHNSSLISSRYDPASFSKAVRAICNKYGLQEFEVEGPLLLVHVFGLNTRKLSQQAIIDIWDDHCHDIKCDYDDVA
ncbi:hypothetical protein LMJ53_15575 [Rheinheimera sp. UJ51]|uniref:hypothetical protein n=1 Tax=unclassified Rheinheimera TaxID=115860 RepID=UPI001E502A9E|nr:MULTISPECIES: hypothetical protein [unclassified Rheinheimera]MCC5453140.1 hypothetical protein [Rheinheimera sp. UJ51]MCF4010643.1 hypothetical protein [Rheinheimera sp. UJ63]